MTREQHQKIARRREKNRQSQLKRRANMSAQKKRREREKRREYYMLTKQTSCDHRETSQYKSKGISITSLLNGVVKTIKRSRTKLALFKLDFVKKLLRKEKPMKNIGLDCRYIRAPRNSFTVEHFFDKVAIDFPGQKNGAQQTKVLTKPIVDLFKQFRKEHPYMNISLTTFKRRRPRRICLSSSRKFLQCLCEKCTNVMLLMNVINPFLKPKSDVCLLNERVTNVDDLVNKTLCENATRDCWERQCEKCGVGPLIAAVQHETLGSWEMEKEMRRWGKNENGMKDLLKEQCSLSDIVAKLETDLETIAKHLKVAQWQRHQYQFLTKNLPPGHGVCTVDFAENYLCRYQDEVQSAHWSYHQVSVHPCVFFYSCKDCRKVVTEYLVILSDDLKHDSCFTRTVLDKCVDHVKEKGLVSLHIFSDGCGAQYKSKTTFMDLSEIQNRHPTVSLTRHFFGSNHGKSLCDSCGGVVKNCATRAVASGEVLIQNAEQMYDFCQAKLFVPEDIGCSHFENQRSFVVLKSEDFDRQPVQALKYVPGTRQIHRLKLSRTECGMLSTSGLSCCCDSCMLGEDCPCPSESFTRGWKTITLQPAVKKSSKTRSAAKKK